MEASRVCVVVVTYNRAELLGRALDALGAQTRAPDGVLVVDNASTDGTRRLLDEREPPVAVHRLDRNTGASGGFCEGARRAYEEGYDWIWLLDDDVAAAPGCLAELLAVADLSGKRVVASTRRSSNGTFPQNEAVIDEAAQAYTAPEREGRWSEIDIFTFEGPLIHRSVFERVGFPNSRFFIIADDTEFSVRVYQAFGPLAGALANDAIVDRLLDAPVDSGGRSGVKRLIMGNSTFVLKSDEQHWKHCYYLRNRHLVWKRLGWRRRRIRQLVAHAGYLFVDVYESMRRGWNWRLRLRTNLRAFALGLAGRDGPFIDPAEYLSQLDKGRSAE